MLDMGQHSRAGRDTAPSQHAALTLLLSMGAAILATSVILGSVGPADRSDSPDPRGATISARSVPAGALSAPAATSATGRPTVELRWTHGRSWVRVTDSKGAVVINDIYPQGTVMRFTGPKFDVEIGNAGVVTVIDKGGVPRIAGETGETVRWTFTGP